MKLFLRVVLLFIGIVAVAVGSTALGTQAKTDAWRLLDSRALSALVGACTSTPECRTDWEKCNSCQDLGTTSKKCTLQSYDTSKCTTTGADPGDTCSMGTMVCGSREEQYSGNDYCNGSPELVYEDCTHPTTNDGNWCD